MVRKLALAATALILFGVTGAIAGVLPPPPPAATSASTTTAFVGLNWVFGHGGQNVEGILGVANGHVSGGGDVTGAKAALHFRLTHGFALRKFKFTGLVGDTNAQFEGGLGFNFEDGNLFGVAGANGDYFAAGADVNFTGGLEAYIGAHSIGDFRD